MRKNNTILCEKNCETRQKNAKKSAKHVKKCEKWHKMRGFLREPTRPSRVGSCNTSKNFGRNTAKFQFYWKKLLQSQNQRLKTSAHSVHSNGLSQKKRESHEVHIKIKWQEFNYILQSVLFTITPTSCTFLSIQYFSLGHI